MSFVLRGFQLLENILASQAKRFSLSTKGSRFRSQVRAFGRLVACILLLSFDRLALPTSCHRFIIVRVLVAVGLGKQIDIGNPCLQNRLSVAPLRGALIGVVVPAVGAPRWKVISCTATDAGISCISTQDGARSLRSISLEASYPVRHSEAPCVG